MPEEKRTTQSILETLKRIVENKEILNAEYWADAALYLEILIGDEHQNLLELQQEVAKLELEALMDSKSVAAAKLKIKATDKYREMRRQELLIKQVDEYVRIAKLQSRIRNLNL